MLLNGKRGCRGGRSPRLLPPSAPDRGSSGAGARPVMSPQCAPDIHTAADHLAAQHQSDRPIASRLLSRARPIAGTRRLYHRHQWPVRTIAALGSLIMALSGCAASPGLGAGSVRIPVDVAAAPWRSLGLVLTEAGGRCTGALVAPRVVLTAAHCLVHPETGRPLDVRLVEFHLALSPQGEAGRARAIAALVGPGFAVLPGPRPDPAAAPDADWAVLMLDGALGEPGLALPLAASYVPPGTPLTFGGYQVDRGRQMVADAACAVTGYGRDTAGRVMLQHSCAGTRGASGGPLLAHLPDGRWVVAGVASLGRNGASGGWAVPTAAVARAAQVAAATGGQRTPTAATAEEHRPSPAQ